MPAGPVVSNHTPLVALWTVARLHLLRDLYREVLIPPSVRDEFLATGDDNRRAALEAAPWLRCVAVNDPRRVMAHTSLDLGEAEALALAEETSAQLLVMDERKGRRLARRLGIPITGTIGVLLLAKERLLLLALAPVLDQLQEAGLYLSPPLVAKALALAGESACEPTSAP
jgi:predicted nucleic acid-binding protein